MKAFNLYPAAILILALPSLANAQGAVAGAAKGQTAGLTFAKDACSSGERWEYGPTMDQGLSGDWRGEFARFLAKRNTVVRGFSEALALRRLGETDEQRLFAEYWISRALF